MTQDEIRDALGALDGVRIVVGSPEAGTPEIAYGDTFCTYAPDDGTAPQKLPFATIVTHDTAGWDEVSDLDRPGAFRVNLAVGREHVPDATPDLDHAREDVVLPHPQYANQGWVAVVNPGEATSDDVRALIGVAYRRARDRHRGG